MTIVVDTGSLFIHPQGYGYYLYECFRRIAIANPEDEFIFISTGEPDRELLLPAKCKIIVAGPASNYPLLWKFWYDLKIPRILKKYKADLFVSCEGRCSLTTRVPQCLFVRELSFLDNPFLLKKAEQVFYRHNMPKFLNKATNIITFSAAIKNEIVAKYRIQPDKIDAVTYSVREIFQPLTDPVKTSVKEKYTAGSEFFISMGPIEQSKNLQSLLKAFSIFKKRQANKWKLLVTGAASAGSKEFLESLKTYKYRDDVVLTGHLSDEELVRVLGSAYALLNSSFKKTISAPVLEAARSNVAILSTTNSSLHQLSPDSALFADPFDYHDIAEKIMLLYKDENLRSRLIENAKGLSEQCNFSNAVSRLSQAIRASANSSTSPRK